MILTCPECATRYFVEDQRLGAGGRTVRCASCGSAWKAQAEEPLELTLSGDEGAVARPEAQPAASAPSLSAMSAPALPRALRARAEQQRKVRDAAAAGIVWAGMTCAFAVLFGAAYLFRMDVVELYPRAAGAYAMAGVRVNPTGLEFQNIKAQAAPDGRPAVTVTGEVRNVIDHAAPPPPLKIALIDRSGRRMAAQKLRLAVSSLRPGQRVAFSLSLPDPAASAADVDVAFDLDAISPAPRAATPRTAAAVRSKAAALPSALASAPPKPALAKAAPERARAASLRPALEMTEVAKPLPVTDPLALGRGSEGPTPPHG